jgi:hypothetical protein
MILLVHSMHKNVSGENEVRTKLVILSHGFSGNFPIIIQLEALTLKIS